MEKSGDDRQRHILRDTSFASFMLGAGETYFGAFAIFLQASALQLGILATLPNFLGAVSQSLSVWATDTFRERRRIAVVGAVANAVTLCPIALLGLLPFPNSTKIVLLTCFICLYFITSGLISPAWNSLIGDLIDVKDRVAFFAKRNRRAEITMLISIVSAGFFLNAAKSFDLSSIGFSVIFFAAAISRFCSARELSRYDNPIYQTSADQKFSFWDFLRRSPSSNFAKFVYFFATINFGVAVSAPYYSLYMLRDLQFSYLQFTIVIAAAIVAQFAALANWGSVSEAFGNKRILVVCGYGVAIAPLLWLFSNDIYYLICVQIFAGIVWSGYNLAVQNFLFDAVTPPKRARCAAYQAIVNGFFVLSGSILGAFLIPHLNQTSVAIGGSADHASNLLYLFLISGLLRLVGTLVFLPLFQEVREASETSYPELIFRVSHVRPVSGFVFSIIPLGRKLIAKEIGRKKKVSDDDLV